MQLLVRSEGAGVGAAGGDANRLQRPDARHRGCVGRRQIAQLTAAVRAPAEQRPRAVRVVGGRAVVRAPGRQRADVGQAGNGRRGRAHGVAADRELAVVVVAPAGEGVILPEPAREARARGDERRVLHRLAAAELAAGVRAPAGDRVLLALAHDAGVLATGGDVLWIGDVRRSLYRLGRRDRHARRPRVHLALRVRAPAVGVAARERAGVIASGGDRGHLRRQRRGRRRRRARPAREAVAELTAGVRAPAGQQAGRVQRAGVLPLGRQLRDLRAQARHHGRQVRAGHAAVAQLTEAVVTPAADGVVGAQRAGEIAARRERSRVGYAGQPGHADNQLGQAAIAAAKVAQLAAVAGAPAEHGGAGGDRARVQVAGRDRRDLFDRRDTDGLTARRTRAVADLAAIVAAPAPKAVIGAHQAGVSAARAHLRDRVVRAGRRHAPIGVAAGVVGVAPVRRRAVLDRETAAAVGLAGPGGRADRALRVFGAAEVARAHAGARERQQQGEHAHRRDARAGPDQNAPPTCNRPGPTDTAIGAADSRAWRRTTTNRA